LLAGILVMGEHILGATLPMKPQTRDRMEMR
jgi:hypothetical protein